MIRLTYEECREQVKRSIDTNYYNFEVSLKKVITRVKEDCRSDTAISPEQAYTMLRDLWYAEEHVIHTLWSSCIITCYERDTYYGMFEKRYKEYASKLDSYLNIIGY